MKDNKLEVGDVLCEYGNWGRMEKLTVVRLTPKQAVLSNGYNCLNIVSNGDKYENRFAVKKVGSYGNYYVWDNEIEIEFQRRQLELKCKNRIRDFNFHNVPESDYQKVIDFITPYLPKKEN